MQWKEKKTEVMKNYKYCWWQKEQSIQLFIIRVNAKWNIHQMIQIDVFLFCVFFFCVLCFFSFPIIWFRFHSICFDTCLICVRSFLFADAVSTKRNRKHIMKMTYVYAFVLYAHCKFQIEKLDKKKTSYQIRKWKSEQRTMNDEIKWTHTHD